MSKHCCFLEKSEAKAKFYTGLHKEQRQLLYELLGDAKNDLSMIEMNNKKSGSLKVTVNDRFLLTLIILRHGYSYRDIGYRFNMARSLVSSIFRTWLQFIYLTFHDLREIMFVKKSDLQKPLPKHFRNSLLRDTRCVIDCSEIFIENSENYTELWKLFFWARTGCCPYT